MADKDRETMINTGFVTFLVKFHESDRKYIVDTLGMQTLLRKHKKLYLKSIKLFDADKEKFVKLPKFNLDAHTSFYTELNENLRERNFIE